MSDSASNRAGVGDELHVFAGSDRPAVFYEANGRCAVMLYLIFGRAVPPLIASCMLAVGSLLFLAFPPVNSLPCLSSSYTFSSRVDITRSGGIRLLYSNVDLREAIFIAPFKAVGAVGGLAIVSDGSLIIGSHPVGRT